MRSHLSSRLTQSSTMRVPKPPMALAAPKTAPSTKPRPPMTALPRLLIDAKTLNSV